MRPAERLSPRAYDRRMRRLLLVLAAAVALTALAAAPVAAHTELSASTPREGSVVRALPDRLELTFSGDLATTGASISVVGPDGVDLVEGPYRFTSREVSVALAPGAGPAGGAYEVTWQVTSADGHTIDGAYAFRLRAPAEDPSEEPSTPAATPSDAASDTPSEPGATVGDPEAQAETAAEQNADQSAEDSDDTDVPAWVFMAGGVVLVALILAGVVNARRRAN